ncbi:hypothetical protein J6590_097101, partial [Homalodisca vitripennis]
RFIQSMEIDYNKGVSLVPDFTTLSDIRLQVWLARNMYSRYNPPFDGRINEHSGCSLCGVRDSGSKYLNDNNQRYVAQL